MIHDPFYARHFRREADELPRFWSRFDASPEFDVARVLDFGCSLGAMCVDLARRGAREVVGVDIQSPQVEFARANVAAEFPELAGRVRFLCGDVAGIEESEFDLIVSKDVFEHVQGPRGVEDALDALARRLKPGGRMLLGWGPLWYSPFGDHRLSKELLPAGDFAIPWGHLIVPESLLVRRVNRARGESYRDLADYGLNKRPYRDYERIMSECGLEIVSYRVNVTRNPLGRVANLLRRLPPLENLLTSTIYCVLEKPEAGAASRGTVQRA